MNRGIMKEYNKLVRDKIPEIMISKNCKPVTRILSDEEYILELNKKLLEEVNEYLKDDNSEEIADILELSSVSAVEQLIFRAKQNIKKSMKFEDND